MIKRLKKLDSFTKSVLVVFAGTSLVNFFNLLYQLLIAHNLSAADFASFNSLLAIFMMLSAPLGTIQLAVAKYSAEFNAHHQNAKIRYLLSDLLSKASVLTIITFLVFWPVSLPLLSALKIPASSSGYILAILLASSWLTPVLTGGVQGLEFFGWLTFSSVITGVIKLALSFIFVLMGFNIAGALGALLVSGLIGLAICYFPLRNFISLKAVKEDVDYKKISAYLIPVAISNFCFIALISFDMLLVKYYFSPESSGVYSLAQMVGKIFLFLPGAISIVMFPRISGLNAKNMDTTATLKKSLLYVLGLCIAAVFLYNLFPAFALKVLTGKIYPESIFLGRLFGISMSFFALLYILIAYFLSVKDLRFIKYLVLFTIAQILAIIFFHQSLSSVQLILCLNAALLFFIHLFLVYKKEA